MTIVIGVLGKDNIIFGGDRCVSDGQKNISALPKIYRKKKMLFGVSGRALLLQHLMHKFNIPSHPTGMTDEKYMNTVFIDALRKLFEKNRVTEIDKNNEDMSSSIIVGYKNKIYYISCDFCITRYESNFVAIGSGREYAIGALEAFSYNGEVITEKHIRSAIKVAAKYNFYCDNNIDIIYSK